MIRFLIKTLMPIIVAIVAFEVRVSAVDLQGDLVQGGLVQGQVGVGDQLFLDDRPVKVGPMGHFVFGFSYDAHATAELKHINTAGRVHRQTLSVRQRQFDVEHVSGLPPKTVTPPPEWTARRREETARVRKGRSFNTDQLFWWEGFDKPAQGRFSGFYGSQRILNGKPRSPHFGLDIANKTGTPVVAPAGGMVRLAAADFLLEGGIVIIDHGFSVTSTLFHMETVTVKEGDMVKKGTQIGTIGAKGRASGPHVDWRINWGQVRLDPGLKLGLE